jgi:hypothetical protein
MKESLMGYLTADDGLLGCDDGRLLGFLLG